VTEDLRRVKFAMDEMPPWAIPVIRADRRCCPDGPFATRSSVARVADRIRLGRQCVLLPLPREAAQTQVQRQVRKTGRRINEWRMERVWQLDEECTNRDVAIYEAGVRDVIRDTETASLAAHNEMDTTWTFPVRRKPLRK
jgi:hypothetical protein